MTAIMSLRPPTATGWRERQLLANTAGLQATDFIDKQNKLFPAQYAVSLTLKTLNKITGGLQDAVLDLNLKCRFNFPISYPPHHKYPFYQQFRHGEPTAVHFRRVLGLYCVQNNNLSARGLWH